MNESNFNKIFSKNLNYYLYESKHTQVELAAYVGVSTASVSNWCKGIKTPRMSKVDLICKFFAISREELFSADGPLIKSTNRIRDELLSHFDNLNSSGQSKTIEYVRDLENNPNYRISSVVNAAHDRTDIEVTEEMKKHDDDIMDDDNF